MRRNKIKNQQSQATAELAVIGALILVAFGVVMSYVQSANIQQSLQMRAFRKALAKSHEDRKEISYTIVKDAPVIDVQDWFGRPNTSRAIVSSRVCAIPYDDFDVDIEDKDDRESLEIYEINGVQHTVEPIKVKVSYDNGDDVSMWVSAPIQDTEYRTAKTRQGGRSKNESGSSISTTTSGSVSAAATTTVFLQNQVDFLIEYLKDLQDAAPDPWDKEFKAQRGAINWLNDLAIIVALILAGYITDTGSECGPAVTVESALLIGIAALVSDLLMYLLPISEDEGEPVSVSVEEGYRASDALSGSRSFSTGSTFTASP